MYDLLIDFLAQTWGFHNYLLEEVARLRFYDRISSPSNRHKQQVKWFPVLRRNMTGNSRNTGTGFIAIASSASN